MNDFYSTGTYKHDPTTFGGYIYNYDYDGHMTMSEVAGRILSDMKFDEKCKQLAKSRERNKNNKETKTIVKRCRKK